jgi:hypothetical protein
MFEEYDPWDGILTSTYSNNKKKRAIKNDSQIYDFVNENIKE